MTRKGKVASRTLAVCAVALSMCLSACQEQGNPVGQATGLQGSWTQPGKNGSHASWGAPGPLPPLRERWHSSGPGFSSGPVLVAGKLVLIGGLGPKVEAFDGSGKESWSFRPEGVAFSLVGLRDLVVVPILSHERPSIVALRASTGEVVWKSEGPGVRAKWLWAAADEDTVVVMSSGPESSLAAWGPNGQRLWQVAVASAGAGTLDPLRPIAAAEGSAVIVTGAGIEAHDLESGRTLWADRPASPLAGPPAIVDGQVLVTVGKPALGLFGNRLVGYSLATGEKSFSRRLDGDVAWFAVDGSTLYASMIATGANQEVAAYRLPDLQRVWSRSLGNLNLDLGGLLPLGGGILAVSLARGGSHLSFHFAGPPSLKPWTGDIPHSDVAPMSEVGGELTGLIPTGSGIVFATRDGGLFAFGGG